MPRICAPEFVLAIALACAGCASPIKPAVLDTSGGKMRQAKNGHCQGGMTADTTNYSRVRLHLQVVERASGRTIYKSDDDASGKVLVDDRGVDQAAEGAARATLKALKESNLI